MALTKTGTDGIKDDAVTLDKLAHGTSSQDGKFLRANNGSAPTFETVNTDLVSDTTPQLGGDLDTNSRSINFGDSSGGGVNRAQFGASNDLKMFHSTSGDSLITNSTGQLLIESNGNIVLEKVGGSEVYLKAIPDGAVELYHNNSKKFETYANGCTVTGNLNAGNVDLADNAKARFGSSNDLEIFHDGTNSKLVNSTGSLITLSDEVRWKNAANNETLFVANVNAGVRLFFDNSQKSETRSDGLGIEGDSTFQTGSRHKFIGGSSSNLELGTYSSSNTSRNVHMNIDSSGRLGLNHNLSGASDYNRLVVHNSHSGSCWMQLTSTATGNGINTDGLAIGLNTANTGHIWLRENADLAFATNGTKRMSILAGGGLAFNNDTAQANALNDYEEGIWTPVGNISGVGSVSGITCRYTKIGRVVQITARFTLSGSHGSSNVLIGGLPFSSGSQCQTAFLIMHNGFDEGGSQEPVLNGHISSSSSNLQFFYTRTNGANWIPVVGTEAINHEVIFSTTYYTDS